MPRDPMDLIDDALKGDDTDYGDGTSSGGAGDNDTGGTEAGEGGDGTDAVGKGTGADPDKRGDTSPPATRTNQSDEGRGKAQQGTAPTNNKAQQGIPGQRQRVGSQFADGKGNIVDKDGKIIAKSGAEARFWQEASRATAQVNNLNQQIQRTQARIQELERTHAQAQQIAQIPQRLGINEQDFNEGMTIMAKWRSDPVWVAREVVARAMSLGHKVTDILGKEVGESVDTRALSMMVDRATAPLTRQQQEAAAATERTTAAERAMNEFLSTHEHAEIHGDAIAHLMGKGATAERAYFDLQRFAYQNNLDFTQPLGPQIDALNAQPAQRSTEQPRRPMANGNGRGSEQQMTTQPAQASAQDSWGDILNRVMRDQG